MPRLVVVLCCLLAACSSSGSPSDRAETGAPTEIVETSPSPPEPTQPATTVTTLPVWPEAVTEPFLAACSTVVDPTGCGCVLDAARANWAVDRFERIATELADGGELPADLVQLVDACR